MNIDWKQLKDYFKTAGNVVYASISQDPLTKQSKGCGIIQFETTDEAMNAIKLLNYKKLGDSELFIRPDVQERQYRDKSPHPEKPKVYSRVKESRYNDKKASNDRNNDKRVEIKTSQVIKTLDVKTIAPKKEITVKDEENTSNDQKSKIKLLSYIKRNRIRIEMPPH